MNHHDVHYYVREECSGNLRKRVHRQRQAYNLRRIRVGRKLGYQGRPPAALTRLPQSNLNSFGITIYRQGVAFTDPNVVVAYFVVHDDPPGTTGLRVPLLSDPFRLVALFLNLGHAIYL